MHYQTQALPDAVDFTRLNQLFPRRYPAALISTTEANKNGRYDILFAYPQKCIELSHKNALSIDAKPEEGSFLNTLDTHWQQEQISVSTNTHELPFTGGWFVFLSYELAAEIEPSLTLTKRQSTIPIALALRCPAAIIHDRLNNQTHIVVENEHETLLEKIAADIQQIATLPQTTQPITASAIVEAEPKTYLQQLDRIKQYIKDGDIFQANLSRAWQIELEGGSNINLFKHLAENNPGSFAALIQLDHQTILSSSPERLLSVRDNIIETRPIAGTRPRATLHDEDMNLSSELLSHPKEIAEHIMLLDLERNDLGRICQPGSIEVNELMVLESYQHVHHIVSNVRGHLRNSITPGEVIAAVFPGGTITGCPKVRCMQILSDMEQQTRGAYTGSLGYINRDGSMDLNILIRTMVREGNHISFRAGGGIVADSDPQSELDETRAKAKGLLKVFA